MSNKIIRRELRIASELARGMDLKDSIENTMREILPVMPEIQRYIYNLNAAQSDHYLAECFISERMEIGPGLQVTRRTPVDEFVRWMERLGRTRARKYLGRLLDQILIKEMGLEFGRPGKGKDRYYIGAAMKPRLRLVA